MWFWTPACVLHWGRYRGQAIAVRTNERDITYQRLAAELTAIAGSARSLGLSQARVAIIANEKRYFISSVLGLQLAGCATVICNPRLPLSQLATTVEDSAPSAVVTDFDIEHSAIAPAFRSVQLRLQTSELLGGSPSDLDAFLVNPRWIQPSLHDEWGVLFTSGSTGAPKAILHHNYSMMTEALAWILELELRKSTVFYVARPIYYTGGLVLTLALLSIGATVIVDDVADPNSEVEVLNAIRKAAAVRALDWSFLVPEQARHFIGSDERWGFPRNPSSVLVMGSPITPAEKGRLADYFKCRVIESWGNSEGLGTITDDDDLITRPSSIGRPFISERIYVIDDDGHVCPPGNIGRLAGSDDSMFSEYLNRPEATKGTKRDSLVISDDLGQRDAEGYFHLLGRAQDAVTLEGRTVVLSQLEARIRKLPCIQEVCLSAIEVDNRPKLFAAVELARSSIITPFEAICREMNGLLCASEKLAAVLVVETIPRLASGKLDRVAMRTIISRKLAGG